MVSAITSWFVFYFTKELHQAPSCKEHCMSLWILASLTDFVAGRYFAIKFVEGNFASRTFQLTSQDMERPVLQDNPEYGRGRTGGGCTKSVVGYKMIKAFFFFFFLAVKLAGKLNL